MRKEEDDCEEEEEKEEDKSVLRGVVGWECVVAAIMWLEARGLRF